MISVSISDVKGFMGHLLSGDSFDSFYLVEISIKKEITYHMDGHIHREYYDDDAAGKERADYCLWKDVRPLAYHIIKGKRLPLALKVVLALPEADTARLLSESRSAFTAEDIEGLYLNLYYEPTGLLLTTGISYRRFSPDKRLENAADDQMRAFLREKGIS